MSQELITQTANQSSQAVALAGGRLAAPGLNAGSVAIESERAIAAIRGQIQVAQMFPRDVAAARAELMDECDVLEFAQMAFYAVPRAGSTITGPSIRLAEACATAYGHMEWGHLELSRGEDKSEVEVYAWDKQKNNFRKRQITVDHYRDTRQGRIKLRDSKDIDDKIANVASKQMRGAILALVPKSFVAAAEARCRATLAGGGGVPLKQRIEKMTDAFAKLGVSADLLKKHLKKTLSEINGDDITDLTAIFNAIKGGDKIADHFGDGEDDQQAEPTGTGAALAASAKQADAATAPKQQQQRRAAAKPASKNTENQGKAVEEQDKPDPVANEASASEAPVTDGAQAEAPAGDEPEPQVDPDVQADDEQAGGAASADDDVF